MDGSSDFHAEDFGSDAFRPGDAWRVVTAQRAAVLIDSGAYFAAAMAALHRARRSVLLLGWGFDPRTRLTPDAEGNPNGPDEIGVLLPRLAALRPELDIRVLIWKSALPISASQRFFPHRARWGFLGTRVRFELDAATPFGACHHQKVLVVDDCVAFVSGGDFGVDRWDSTGHRDHDMRRVMPGGARHAPRHETTMLVDGDAARALGDLARRRWARAGLRPPAPVDPADRDVERHDPWPHMIAPQWRQARIAIARTEPAWRGRPEVREIEALHLDAIRHARRTIYLENQYFTSVPVGEALAERLAEPDGPDVVLISSAHSPSYFDRWTMDRTRWKLIERLKAADRHGRFRAYCPHTSHGRPIIVHSKVSVIDDVMLRVGSANLNHRSAGFDTECDLALEAPPGSDQARTIEAVRARMVGHFLGMSGPHMEAAIAEHRGLVKALDRLTEGGKARLRPMQPLLMGPLARIISALHLGDPTSPADSFKPLLRRRLLDPAARALAGARRKSGKVEVDNQGQVV
ncbi:MAG TPA: phospholipase D-like domain-containing protein [Caulobacteraceae bacterium]|nr:phospholipase D-like domain-containing protein [Caulobacteraceae bacterium]